MRFLQLAVVQKTMVLVISYIRARWSLLHGSSWGFSFFLNYYYPLKPQWGFLQSISCTEFSLQDPRNQCSPRRSSKSLRVAWGMLLQQDHIAENVEFHSKVKLRTEENIHKIHSFLMKTLNTQSFVFSLLCPAYCLRNKPPNLGKTKMPQCLSTREISGFQSLQLRNYFSVMGNNENKLSGRFENKCFSEPG